MNNISPVSLPAPLLVEGQPFYDHNPESFYQNVQDDLSQPEALPASYVWNTESKVAKVAKLVFSIIIFPVGLYQLIHNFLGKVAFLPASNVNKELIRGFRTSCSFNEEWLYKRITIEVDGMKIDAVVTGKISTFHNGRWMLHSFGNGEFYEHSMGDDQFREIWSQVDTNAILFNYPGVGDSTGIPNRGTMVKAYRAMLNFLEDQENGMRAKEIVGFGHSMGGGVQGDALKSHALKEGIKYVFVKSRTFSDLSTATSCVLQRIAPKIPAPLLKSINVLVKIFGWNISSVETSKNLPVPEIIMQTAKVEQGCYEKLTDISKIRCDGVIAAEASLAKVLLDDPTCPKDNKVFIGMSDTHNEGVCNPAFVAGEINSFLNDLD